MTAQLIHGTTETSDEREMTAQLIHGTTETTDEGAESSEASVRAILGATLTFLALVALWELLVRVFHIPGWFLPAPSAIAMETARQKTKAHAPKV